MTDLTRDELTARIIAAKRDRCLKWTDLAEVVGMSKEWTAAVCLGQMMCGESQARALADVLGLDAADALLLHEPPYRGSLPTVVPTDPLIYRFHEIVQVYGTTFKALIHEEFGDGIMSAIDFTMGIARESDPAGDRVRITLSGKFLPYRQY